MSDRLPTVNRIRVFFRDRKTSRHVSRTVCGCGMPVVIEIVAIQRRTLLGGEAIDLIPTFWHGGCKHETEPPLEDIQ